MSTEGARGTEGFEWWRRTLSYKTGLGLTEQEKVQYEEDYAKRQTLRQCVKCEEYRDWMLKYSPTVIFMKKEVEKVGGNLGRDNIICGPCDEMKSGGFHPELGIMICSNRIYSSYQLEDTMAHEMIHAYDHCKFNVDWMNLKHHACSEIRASNLSGECRMMNQFWRNRIFKVSRAQQDCVKRRATLSVMGNPNCKSKEQAEMVVNEVFDACFNDTRPFEAIYR